MSSTFLENLPNGDLVYENETYILEKNIYEYRCADRGLLLPIINEYTWSDGLRSFLYLIGLLYCFLGVAIIADIFMGAIEKITSKTRKVSFFSVLLNKFNFRKILVKYFIITHSKLVYCLAGAIFIEKVCQNDTFY